MSNVASSVKESKKGKNLSSDLDPLIPIYQDSNLWFTQKSRCDYPECSFVHSHRNGVYVRHRPVHISEGEKAIVGPLYVLTPLDY